MQHTVATSALRTVIERSDSGARGIYKLLCFQIQSLGLDSKFGVRLQVI